MSQDLISIALCTYNGEKYLTEQLQSLVGQTHKHLEIVIVDDLSDDNSFNILESFKEKHPEKIKLYRNDKNLGFTKNFEKAISLCSGKFIALCDQDDIWHPDKIKILYEEIENYTLIYHDSFLIDAQSTSLNKRVSDTLPMYKTQSNLFFLRNNSVAGHALMFKNTLIPYFTPLDDRFYHDWWIAFVASTVGTIKYLNTPLVYHRQHESGFTSGSGKDKEHSMNQGFKNEFIDYNLAWINHLRDFKFAANYKEINFIAAVLNRHVSGHKGWKYFIFLFRYYETFMCLPQRKRSFFSRINYIRKLYRTS